MGFLPSKSGPRVRKLKSVQGIEATLIFYVPPPDLQSVLQDCMDVLGADRRCCVARELTKIHEQFCRSTLGEAVRRFHGEATVGEITLLIEGAGPSSQDSDVPAEVLEMELQQRIAAGEPLSQAVKAASRELGVGRKRAYQAALRLAKASRPAGES
ncbi:unnamed protein product [Ostreobium quekettii]|uniref:Ribosomal RNA small subunit methyltransferase I n=1 Tax=Ostreobium quekettii TaxID=121088 RepID=A0A8S1JGT7_9CHLO|nr:unnamed protein product [Ostreobium quekettii]